MSVWRSRSTFPVATRAVVWPQNPIRLADDTEPQPDVVLLRPRGDDYRRAVARPEDVLLLIEVADSSQRYDRLVKLPLYARTGVAEVWIVDLQRDAIEVYRRPVSGGYERTEHHGRGAVVTPEALPDISLAVDEVLGPPD